MARPKKDGSKGARASTAKAANGKTMAIFILFREATDRAALEGLARHYDKPMKAVVIDLIREAADRAKANEAGWRLTWVRA